jgi:protein phosphatase
MGGHAAGEVASRLAIETVRGAFFADDDAQDTGPALQAAVRLANEVIHTRGLEDTGLTGMGTTCVAATVTGTDLKVAHVGDSRAYLVHGLRIQQLTRDHNLTEEFVTVGKKGPEGAQHVLTRTLGGGPDVEVDLTPAIRLWEDDVIVLCSDGLSNVVSQEEILEAVLENAPAFACRRLIEQALRRGAPDNVTVTVARVETQDGEGTDGSRS